MSWLKWILLGVGLIVLVGYYLLKLTSGAVIHAATTGEHGKVPVTSNPLMSGTDIP